MGEREVISDSEDEEEAKVEENKSIEAKEKVPQNIDNKLNETKDSKETEEKDNNVEDVKTAEQSTPSISEETESTETTVVSAEKEDLETPPTETLAATEVDATVTDAPVEAVPMETKASTDATDSNNEKSVVMTDDASTLKTEESTDSKKDVNAVPKTVSIVEVKVSPRKKINSGRKIAVEEYFVKYKNFSYLHCDWRTEEELLKGDKRISGKIRRFKQKRYASMNIMDFVSALVIYIVV